MKTVYVGSSWKNTEALDVVHKELQKQNFATWDFRRNGFWWQDIPEEYTYHSFDFIQNEKSIKAFEYDLLGLTESHIGLFILPAGISTALEAGFMCGRGKPVFVYGDPRDNGMNGLDVMWRMATKCFKSKVRLPDVISEIKLFSKTYF